MSEPTSVLHRHPKTRNFTQIENSTIRDSGLTYRATGLLIYLLSLPHGAPIDSKTMADRKVEGRDAVRTAYAELVNAGYVHRTRHQRANDGQWVTVIHVFEVPRPDFQASGSQSSEIQASDSQALSLSESKTERKEQESDFEALTCDACHGSFAGPREFSDHFAVCVGDFVPASSIPASGRQENEVI